MNHSTWILAISILSSSLVGSWHCAGMCGPIATWMAHKGNLKLYHLGRFVSYVGIGALVGALGKFFLQSDFYWLRIGASALLVATLLWMALNLILWSKKTSMPRFAFLHKWTFARSSSWAFGLLSVFLPCGWLYTYVLAAATTQSVYSGSLVMLLFWLGTLPALSAFPVFMRQSIALSNQRKQRLAGLILFAASLYAVGSFYFLH